VAEDGEGHGVAPNPSLIGHPPNKHYPSE